MDLWGRFDKEHVPQIVGLGIVLCSELIDVYNCIVIYFVYV